MKKLGLIGFAGSGKSAVLRKAENEGYRTIDTDRMMKESGIDLDRLILDDSIDEMRKIERTIIKKAVNSDFDVIAFGGGFHPGHIGWDNVSGSETMMIFLKQSFDKCVERAPDRPLIRKLGMSGYRMLFDERQNKYSEGSHHTVTVSEKSLDDIWFEVKKIWN